jgi:predicted outer membrane protein
MDVDQRAGGAGTQRTATAFWRYLVTLAVVAASTAFGAGTVARAADGRDQTVVAELRLMNEHAAALADLGSTRISRDTLQTLTSTMAEDHRAAARDLLAYAEARGMNMAAVGQPGADRPLHGPLAFDELRATPVARFDYEFATRVVTDQQAAVDELTSARGIVHDPQLVALIDAQLPAVRLHLAQARSILANIPAPTPTPGPPSAVTPPL